LPGDRAREKNRLDVDRETRMNTRMKLAVACHAANGIVGLSMAARYWMADRFMAYQAVASGVEWGSLPPGVQFVLLGLLKVAAAAFLAYGVVSLMVIRPVTRGENWARRTALASGLALLIPLLYVTSTGRIATGAAYPVVPSASVAALALIAFFASRMPARSAVRQAGDGLRHAPPAI